MPLNLSQLRTTVTKDEALTFLLTELASLGFGATSWQSGSVQRTLVEMFASVYSNLTLSVDAISRIAFNDTSEGAALTAFSYSHYDNTRLVAVSTQGDLTLAGAAVGPPHAIVAGQIVVSDSDGVTYRNTTGGTIPASGSLVVTIQADTAGAAANVANGTITTLTTPLAGVTCSNDAIAPSATWITQQGVNEETDASLRIRNSTKWATLSPSDPADRYINFIRTAVAGAARVIVDDSNPAGPGTVHIYIAGPSGVSGASDVAAAQAEADRIRNPTAEVEVFAAAAQTQLFQFTCYITSSLNNAVTQAAVEQSLTDYVNDLPIGGTVFPPALTGEFVFSEAVGAMTSIAGVQQVVLTTPPANVTIANYEIMTVSAIAPTYVSV